MVFLKKITSINDSGFTLIEMMTTVAIIMIMTAVYLVDYRQTNQKIILDQAAAGLVSDLRNVQNMSMNVKKFGSEVPCGGYGININSSTSYIIFADKDNNPSNSLCDNDNIYTAALTEKVNDRSFPAHINILSSSFTDLVFQPPSPVVWVDGSAGVALSTIVLQYGSGAGVPPKTITINGYTGQISVN